MHKTESHKYLIVSNLRPDLQKWRYGDVGLAEAVEVVFRLAKLREVLLIVLRKTEEVLHTVLC